MTPKASASCSTSACSVRSVPNPTSRSSHTSAVTCRSRARAFPPPLLLRQGTPQLSTLLNPSQQLQQQNQLLVQLLYCAATVRMRHRLRTWPTPPTASAAAVMTQSLALNKHQTQRRCDRLAFRAIHQSQTELGRNARRRSALSISRKIETHTPIKALIMDP